MPRNAPLAALLSRMASRDKTRTEANVQSDLHAFLLAAPLLSLEERDIEEREVTLEQQAGSRKRIDVETGLCVFEVKRNLRVGNVRNEAVKQLAFYVAARSLTMKQRYVGVITDGAEWHLYHLVDGSLQHVSELLIDSAAPDVDGLCLWLESVLSTEKNIQPTPREIEKRLGATSPRHALDFAGVWELYERNRNLPTVKLKRELWARLLTTALGTGFRDDDKLFVEHTLLVAMAEVIAHSVIGFDVVSPSLSGTAIVTGQLFASAGVHGVVEADFFDWITEVEGGSEFIKALARRLSRFAWKEVEHDVLKVLYESVIDVEQRKQLGEYYTPDWLADQVTGAAVSDPLTKKVLDPSCGSGTFLFHAIRRYLEAANTSGLTNTEALTSLTKHVIGMDIHPVAVTFARVTYLLAIGPTRLQSEDRPFLSIPVYLGDSIQWGQDRTLFSAEDDLVIQTGSAQFGAKDLKFPKKTLRDADQFERLVAELTDLASLKRRPGEAVPSLKTLIKKHDIAAEEVAVVTETFKTLCSLHDQGRNHIWGYYVRNLARPIWLARQENRVDALIGNPPWLSYRRMTPEMQAEFARLSKERGLSPKAATATTQDLSALFVLRSVERYLKEGGIFGFVMPWAVLRGPQYRSFRSGHYTLHGHEGGLSLAFEPPWDLHAVKPSFFPVPASVILGHRRKKPFALPKDADKWSGRLPQTNLSWDKAKAHINRKSGAVVTASEGSNSGYHALFFEGATFVPRVALVVNIRASGPLGAAAGQVAVISSRSPLEKAPWKTLQSFEGHVERQFVRPMQTGETVLPFRTTTPLNAIVPWEGERLLDGRSDGFDLHPGLADWWSRAEEAWNRHRKNSKLSLLERVDFHKGLTQQFADVKHRVVYSTSGMYLAAAMIDEESVIGQSLHWGSCRSAAEARYLLAILNSTTVTHLVRPLQARGEHNPRHYAKLVWQLKIPPFDPTNTRHVRLSQLAKDAEALAATVDISDGKRFETLRGRVRKAIEASPIGHAIEKEVTALLTS